MFDVRQPLGTYLMYQYEKDGLESSSWKACLVLKKILNLLIMLYVLDIDTASLGVTLGKDKPKK